MKFFAYTLALLLVAAFIAGPFVAPYAPQSFELKSQMQTPTHDHVLGTDELGRDILSRLLYGARVSLGIAFVVVSISLSVGLLMGFISGYFGGLCDKIFIAISDVFQAFPGFLLAIALAAFLPPSILNVIFLLSFVGWVGYARLARAQVMGLKEREFLQATKALGVPLPRVFFLHVLPNIAGPILVQAAFGMAGVILVESSLSFLGLGLPVTVPSWGKMLDSGTGLLLAAPHISIFPGLAIMVSVLTFNLLGDTLRDRYQR
ncbi:ABC transporter permease [bacterium]|nr:ABC transporter permease [bacterium]